MITITLGPSWLPKGGALLVAFAGAIDLVPPTAPGAAYIKPYQMALMALGSAIIGFSTRQNNVSSERAGASINGRPPTLE